MGPVVSKFNFEAKRHLIVHDYIIYNENENDENYNHLKCKNKNTNKCYELEIYCFKVSFIHRKTSFH
jgi:hypothetical protein